MDYKEIGKGIKHMLSGGKGTEKRSQAEQENYESSKVEKIMTKFSYAKTARTELTEKWKRFVLLYRGEHWAKTNTEWRSKTVENMCFSIIEAQIPLMTDKAPEINILPQTEEDIDIAEQLNQVIKYVWNSDKMQEKLPEIIRDQLMIGTGIAKIFWDDDKLNGLGDISVEKVDPFTFYNDPNATDQDNMEWCIHVRRMSPRKVKKYFGKDVPSDSDYQREEDGREIDGRNNYTQDECTVIDYWYLDEEDNVNLITCSNGVLLEEKQSPYDLKSFPFVFFYDHKMNGQFWGFGELDNLEPLQKELNKIRQVVVDNLIATNNSILLVDKTAGVDTKRIRNEPGLVIEKNPGGDIRHLEQPSLPSYITNQIEITKNSIQEITGIHDVSKGIASGQTAASAIQLLTENSQTRIRGKLRNAENAIARLGDWFISMMRFGYTEVRTVRLTDDQKGFKFLDFDPNALRPQVPVIDEETGQPQVDDQGNAITEEGITPFDINVTSGSSMLLNKSAKYQQMLELYQNQAIDLETLLESAEVGEPQKVIQRMVKYGTLKDPNSPQQDLTQVLSDLGIRFSMSTTEPLMIKEALDRVNQSVDQMNQEQQANLQEVDGGQAQMPQQSSTNTALPTPPQFQMDGQGMSPQEGQFPPQAE